MEFYEQIRIPHLGDILDRSKQLGDLQDRRANEKTAGYEDMLLKGEVMLEDTVAVMFAGATHNYEEEVEFALADAEGGTNKGPLMTEEEAEQYMVEMGM